MCVELVQYPQVGPITKPSDAGKTAQDLRKEANGHKEVNVVLTGFLAW